MSTTKLSGANDAERLEQLSSRIYKDQAVWFLNAFWEDFAKNEGEKLWSYVETMGQIDIEKKAEGIALDEAQAHRFLEKYNETMTVSSMREKLRSTGAIGIKIKLVPLVHLLIFKYNVDWKYLVNAPQGSKEEIDKAQALLDEVQAAFQASEARAQEAKDAFREAQSSEAEAKKREADAKAREADAKARETEALAREAEAREREAPFKAAQEEVDTALADVRQQETTRDNKTEELKRKSTEGGVVAQNKAKAELAQHLAQDPLPLSKAKITLEAALKKAEKSRAPFDAATKEAEAARSEATQARTVAETAAKQATQSRTIAENARKKAEAAKIAADEAYEEARRRLEEAEVYLEEAKARLPKGSIWWLERTLQEKKKYLPERKGGVKKN